MRDIKFRVWDKDSKKYDSLYYQIHPNGILSRTYSDGEPCRELNQEHYIFEQFTGLQDSEDNDIYEGDIISRDWMGSKQTRLVTWNVEDACFDSGGDYLGCEQQDKIIIVVGNVNQNPELLR